MSGFLRNRRSPPSERKTGIANNGHSSNATKAQKSGLSA
jgi:hypothetical protein